MNDEEFCVRSEEEGVRTVAHLKVALDAFAQL